MTRILAVTNQKGGVGKTTTAVNLAASLARLGHPTLLVDLDPQGNASSGLGLPKDEAVAGTYDLLHGLRDLRSVLVPTAEDDLHLVPATEPLAGAEEELTRERHRETRLRRALEDVPSDYTFVILDCRPSLGLLTVNALAAAHGLIIPVQAEYYALEGLRELLRIQALVRKALNPGLRREGLVVTMQDQRTNLGREVEEQLRALFGEEVFRTVIPRNVRVSEAPSHGKPVIAHAPSSRGARAYLDLARELLDRCGLASTPASSSQVA